MKAHYRLKSLRTLIASTGLVLLLWGCAAGRGPYGRGVKAELARDYDTALNEYRLALERDPGNIDYRLKYEQTRFEAAFTHFQNGRRALEKNDLETAKRELQRTIELDPTNDMAGQELKRIAGIESSRERKQPEPERTFEDMRDSMRTDPSPQAVLEPKLSQPITFRMTQDSRVTFETLAQLAGFNVIFDRDFRGQAVAVDLKGVDIYQALDIVAMQTQAFWVPYNKNTILVSPDNQTKRRDYDPHILKTIYLSNSVTSTEITEAITILRTILNMRYIAQYTAMNAIVVRDTPDKIAIAEKILMDVDKSKPEVVVEAMVLEADRNQLRTLGIVPPTGTTLSFGTPTTTDGETNPNNSVNLRDLNNINSGSFSIVIPNSAAQALATASTAKLIQNPKIRATDGKLASIRIGSKIPVPSGSFQPAFVGATGTPVVQYVYTDIGVNLDITPRVLLNRDVSLTVLVQVSALAGERDAGGLKLPVFTNRSITHDIRLAEGETNILGGIITTRESTSMSGIPGLKDIPIVKYLFGQETKERDDAEIIVMLTPHIVRMPALSEENLRGLSIGSETFTRLRTLTTPEPQPAAPPAAPSGSATPPPASPNPGGEVRPNTPPPPPGVASATPPAANAPLPAAPRPTATSLSFAASPATLTAGQPTSLSVAINGNDIYAADLTLSFDPAAVRIEEIREGGFLSKDNQIIALVQKIDSETGIARISLERPPGAAALSGTGPLLNLMLLPGTKKGDTVIKIVDFRLRDSLQNVFVGKPAETRITVP
jgi:general secretion pathway protein D